MEPILPFDIIIEILSRLPVKSLLRYKSVCKQWSTLFQDYHFIGKHLDQGTYIYHFSDACKVQTSNTDGTIQERFEWILSAGGLLLEGSSVSNKYRIRNPAMHLILDLPDSQEYIIDINLSYVSTSGNYKVVSVYGGKGGNSYGGFEILTLEDEHSWRPITTPNLNGLDNISNMIWLKKASEAIHCVRTRYSGSNDYEVVSLDLDDECITCNTLSRRFFPDCDEVCIFEWDKGLAFAEIVKDELHALVLEDHKKHKWGKSMIVVPLTFLKESQDVKKELTPDIFYNNVLYFWLAGAKALAYDIESKKILYTTCPPEGKSISYVYIPSLQSFKGMRPAKNYHD